MELLNDILFFLWDSFPNVAAVLIGAFIITYYLPRRSHYWMRVAVAFFLIGIWMFWGKRLSTADGTPRLMVSILAFSGLFLFAGASVMFCSVASWHQALFAVTVSYALQNACERIIEIPLKYWDWFPRQAIIPLLVISLILQHRFIKQYRKKQSVFDFSNVDDRILLFIAAGVMTVCVALDLVLKGELAEAGPAVNTCISIVMIMFSFLTILVSICHLRETDTEKRAEEAMQMLRNEQRRFEYDKQIHDAINIKCHDIRHQIAAIRSTSTDDAYRAELKKIGKLVDIYDSTPHSRNAALDLVLAGKMLTCNSLNITITCMADGRRLGFMEDCDVYALFGNILDNAIEAAGRMQDPQQRMIALTVETKGDFLVIECENYFAGELTFEDGLPLTTKADQENHGFGTHSIRLLAEKYDGFFKLSSQDDIFTLSILLPIPA